MHCFADDTRWSPFAGFEGLYYHIVSVDREAGVVDMLMKFDPQTKCIRHCHVGPTKTLVIEGEHRIYEDSFTQAAKDIRPAGTFSANRGDETHVEGGGREGAVILLMMTAVDGYVYDLFDDDGKLIRRISLDDFERGLVKQTAAA